MRKALRRWTSVQFEGCYYEHGRTQHTLASTHTQEPQIHSASSLTLTCLSLLYEPKRSNGKDFVLNNPNLMQIFSDFKVK